MLVLLDLSAAFDTIDHDNLFCILETYVGMCGNALLSEFTNIICGVPQGSVLGPLKFVCIYCL